MSQIWALLMRGFWSGGHKNSVWAGSGQEWQMKPGYSDRLFFFLVYNIFNIFESIIYCYKSVCFFFKKISGFSLKKKKKKKPKNRKKESRETGISDLLSFLSKTG